MPKITDHFHLCELESNHKQFKIFGRVDGYRISILLGRPYGMAQKFKTTLGVIRFHCPLRARKLYHCQSMISRLDLEQRSQRNSIPPNWIIDSQTNSHPFCLQDRKQNFTTRDGCLHYRNSIIHPPLLPIKENVPCHNNISSQSSCWNIRKHELRRVK